MSKVLAEFMLIHEDVYVLEAPWRLDELCASRASIELALSSANHTTMEYGCCMINIYI